MDCVRRHCKRLLGFYLSLHLLAVCSPLSALEPCKDQVSQELCVKIGQMLIVGFGGLKQDDKGNILWQDPNGTKFSENSIIARQLKDLQIGGVILFNRPYRNNKTGKFIKDRNIQSPAQLKKLTADLQAFSKKQQKSTQDNLPLLISIDQEGGIVNRLPTELGFSQTTLIPEAFGNNEARAKSPNSKKNAQAQTREYADTMAAELSNMNINVNFAPCLDLNLEPINVILGGRGRCFSDNPEIVANQATQFIQAFQAKGIIPTLKHFPGHGSSLEDTHKGLVDVTESYQKEKELWPYQHLIDQGYQSIIMTTHVINGQIDRSQCKPGDKEDPKTWCPGTMSYATITGLLREKLGFKGLIVSDDMTMGAITNEYNLDLALEKSINAGVDMFIIANSGINETETVINTIAQLIKAGKIKEAQIERAYQNIVTLKKGIKK